MAERPYIDASDVDRWTAAVLAASPAAQTAMSRAINDAGNYARTRVVRTLATQMGLAQGTVRQGLTTIPARRSLVYELNSTGGYLSLKSFDAQQRRAGVSARPWGRRKIFRGTFIIPRFGGQVFRRTTSARFPIVKLWGPAMPQELVRDKVPDEFERAAEERLGPRLRHHLDRLFPNE